MNDNEKYIDEFIRDIPFEAPDVKHRDELKNQLLSAFPKHRLQATAHTVNVWRTIMKSKISKMAAAAAIIIALLIGIHQLGGSTPAFAEVVQSLLNIQTATFKMSMEVDGSATPKIRLYVCRACSYASDRSR